MARGPILLIQFSSKAPLALGDVSRSQCGVFGSWLKVQAGAGLEPSRFRRGARGASYHVLKNL